ncbi:MAG TPA: DinB family protein [Ferruginibacter sp.]|nr:DinB family protein [Ferruginibacter sp.]HMP21043.1 DinB family protein [Ferruginibacter sp.]
MKKIISALAVAAMLSCIPAKVGDALTEKEKQTAIQFLTVAEQNILAAVAGLTEAQLKFKPEEDKWSIEDNLKHIATTEISLWQFTNGAITAPANPEKRADIKMTDEQVMKNVADRSTKVKTMPEMEPQNTPYTSAEAALASFKENRAKLITYVKDTKADIRNHVAILPFGSFDCYQMILFIGAHSNRHLQQINEVKAHPDFPKVVR